MVKERFTKILEEVGYVPSEIQELWLSRPIDDLTEDRLRITATHMLNDYEIKRLLDKHYND